MVVELEHVINVNDCSNQKPPDTASPVNKAELNFVSMNINSLSLKLKDKDNLKSLTCCDVIFISETWLTEGTPKDRFVIKGFTEKNVPRVNLHKNARRGSGGCIVYVKNKFCKYVDVVKTVCDHFCILQLSGIFSTTCYLIMSYIPPDRSDYICKSCDGNYMETLTDLIMTYSKKGNISVCGDLNGRTGILSDIPSSSDFDAGPDFGSDSPLWKIDIPQRTSMDKIDNPRGHEIIHLCQSTGLRILNGRCFDDKGIGKFTFFRGKGKSVNDYVLSDEVMYTYLTKFSVGSKWPETDHCPLYFSFSISHFDEGTSSCSPVEGLENYEKFLWNDSDKESLISCLCDNLSEPYLNSFYDCIFSLHSSEVTASVFSEYISQACERSLKSSKNSPAPKKSMFPNNPWYDNECKVLKSKYHTARKSAMSKIYGKGSKLSYKRIKQCKLSYEEVSILEGQYRRLIQKKKRLHYRGNLLEIQNCTNQKDLWKALNKLKGQDPPTDDFSLSDFLTHFSMPPIDNPNNMLEFDERHEKEMKDFLACFTNNNDFSPHLIDEEEFALIKDTLNSVITDEEVLHALNSLKKGKSSGIDGIPIDVFLSSKQELCCNLTLLFNYRVVSILNVGVWVSLILFQKCLLHHQLRNLDVYLFFQQSQRFLTLL